jgi:hypothetical protein
MNTLPLSGTLTISTPVCIGDREKTVTLATITGVLREECEEQANRFCAENPQFSKTPLFATWVVREHIYISPSMRSGVSLT